MTRTEKRLLTQIIRARVDLWRDMDREFGIKTFPEIKSMVVALADELDAPGFDRKQFIKDCGVIRSYTRA